MKVVHIADMAADKAKVAAVKSDIQAGKHVFMLIYMQGCGPCNATRPEWAKIDINMPNAVVVDVDKDCISAFSGVVDAGSISGFPTLRYLNGTFSENYEDISVSSKDRTARSFNEWIKIKAENAHESPASRRLSRSGGKRRYVGGGSRKRRITKYAHRRHSGKCTGRRRIKCPHCNHCYRSSTATKCSHH